MPRLSTGVFKRPDSPFYWLDYVDAYGKRHRISSKCTRLKDAQAVLRNIKNEMIEKRVYPNKKPAVAFSVLANKYLDWITPRQKSVMTSTRYVIGQLVDYFGGLDLTGFNAMIVDDYVTYLLKQRLCNATINKKLSTLKTMFSKAVQWGFVDKSVHDMILCCKPLKVSHDRLRYLTTDECSNLVDSCDFHLKPIVQMALYTGMRRGELFKLRWDTNIDLINGYIKLSGDYTKNSKPRDIPISRIVFELLTTLKSNSKSVWVFQNPSTGGPYTTIKNSFRAACSRVGIEDFRFHDLRHTFASHMVMSGMDLPTLASILGHSDIKMTMRYSHLDPEHRKKMSKIVSDVFGPSFGQMRHNS